MSRQLLELESVLQHLVAEHRKLLGHLDAQQAAMRKLDVRAMDESAAQQEACRLRIAGLENRRRSLAAELGRSLRLEGDPTVRRIAQAVPAFGPRLMALRDELKGLVEPISSRVHVTGRLAGAVLGHLNTVVRILAGAVQQAGVYTRHGIPQVGGRIGVMEAVG